jgi:hypothetical protein
MVTVEGEYQNVRRFIRDIERSRQFVVINEVELQRATQNNAPASAYEGAANPAGFRQSRLARDTTVKYGDLLSASGAVEDAPASQE